MSFNKNSSKNYLADNQYGPVGTSESNSSFHNEAIPNYSTRVDIESVITAAGITPGKADTNAQIVIGRDRWPEDRDSSKRETIHNSISTPKDSGYSDYHGAGAIDMVVGRMAPYPLEITGGPVEVSPLYTTVKSKIPSVTATTLANGDRHSGIMMDAARIYMSQMCDIDQYFKLKRADSMYANNQPSSAIMLKADRLRLHSRRDVYIHAGGDEEVDGSNIDSCGVTLLDAPQIHLMVGNGTLDDDGYVAETKDIGGQSLPGGSQTNYETTRGQKFSDKFRVSAPKARQQPIPRGENLLECLDQMCQIMKDSFEQINNFILSQNELNMVLAHHIHGTAVGMTTADPISQIKYCTTAIDSIRGMISAFQSVYANLPAIRLNYLDRSGYRYINSRYVTVT